MVAPPLPPPSTPPLLLAAAVGLAADDCFATRPCSPPDDDDDLWRAPDLCRFLGDLVVMRLLLPLSLLLAAAAAAAAAASAVVVVVVAVSPSSSLAEGLSVKRRSGLGGWAGGVAPSIGDDDGDGAREEEEDGVGGGGRSAAAEEAADDDDDDNDEEEEEEEEEEDSSSGFTIMDAPRLDCSSPSMASFQRLKVALLKRFFTAFSVRPSSSFAILFQRLPKVRCASRSCWSSAAAQGPVLIDGSSWLYLKIMMTRREGKNE